ncbi:sugar phosphate isomerase/epimerase [Paenibacillus contaminans]|uniref:Sugar phosphate isomerase/epimerase n=2 Tax=Paenibacillus contaminans TaxID=450362 RepID=A0A329MTZ3_9BACL|nr:sugar phosphate isomerase/epimerase [Paenibacillus contaminans]
MFMTLPNKIGVIVDSFRAGMNEGLKKAKAVGADGVQMHAVRGEMDPDNLQQAVRKELRAYIGSLGLDISALCGDLGGYGFQDRKVNPDKIEKSKRILDLAVDLGTNVVTTHIGHIPEEADDPICAEMRQACEELSEYAAGKGAYFAIETGPETAERLKRFLDSFSSKGVAVNFDPANMVMVTGDDPAQGVRLLKSYIVHTHAKDGISLRKVDPRIVYSPFGFNPMDHEETAAMMEGGRIFREVPLGEGSVNFDAYFGALEEIGYTGYLTIEREVGDDPEADIRRAVEFIRKYRK